MTTTDEPPFCTLDSADAVDELYSELLYGPPALVLTPDERRWNVWVFHKDETLQLIHLDAPCERGWRHEPTSFADAYRYVRGGKAWLISDAWNGEV